MELNMKHRIIASVVVLGLMTLRSSAQRPASFDDSLVVAPHYVEYLSDPTERFVRQAAELKRRIGSAPTSFSASQQESRLSFPRRI